MLRTCVPAQDKKCEFKMFGFRKQSAESLVGQAFQPAAPASFGREMPVWIVQSIFEVGAVQHARLVGRDQPGETRIVALSVLTDPKRYRRVS
jgi:hypothetical protein